jgi:Ca2+/H+ antiporter
MSSLLTLTSVIMLNILLIMGVCRYFGGDEPSQLRHMDHS